MTLFRDRAERKRRYGIGVWDQVGYEGAARSAWQELDRRDKNVLLITFDQASEPLVMVFARRSRAEDVQRLLADIIKEPR